jgi:formylglycine-generating enzyme required for sulfatase activity
VPAGGFIFQDGQEKELREFYIDATEVTVGHYARCSLMHSAKNTMPVLPFRQPRLG